MIPKTLSLFAEVAAEVFAERFTPDHCVNGSRVAIEVLKRFGIEAKPLSVDARVMNQVWWDLLNAKGRGPESRIESDEWAAKGGHAMGIDTVSQHGTDWAGHLVVIARGCLVDSATVQFARPHKAISPPDVLVTDLDEGFLDGKVPLGVTFPDGSCIIYRARLDDKSYLGVSGFQRSPHNLDCAAEIVTRMKARGA